MERQKWMLPILRRILEIEDSLESRKAERSKERLNAIRQSSASAVL